MNTETIVYCVVALILGMLLANMLKSVCGCNKVVEGNKVCPPGSAKAGQRYNYGCGPFPHCCDGTLWSSGILGVNCVGACPPDWPEDS